MNKYIIAGIVILIAIAGFLFFQNSQNEELNESVSDKVQELNNNQDLSNIDNNSKTMTDTNSPDQTDQATTTKVDLAAISQAIIKTNMGDITVKFYRADAPKTVENFVKLAAEGFFNGVKFHRVIKDFMIQTGDPLSKDNSKQALWGTGGPGYKFADEINDHKLVQGSLAMANSGPNTNGSQFFIVTAPATPWLDGRHTNFGQVIDGLDVALAISQVATEGPDRPVEAVVIEGVELK